MVTNGQRPVALSLYHDPRVMRQLGVRRFDVGVSHRSGTYQPFYVTRDGWMAFVREVAEGRAHENGVLKVVHSSGRGRHLFGGEEVPTPWCLRTVAYDQSIYLTDEEWDEFRRLARAGDLDVPPTPEILPTIGRIGRMACGVLLGLAVVALLSGVAWSLSSGSGRWALLGTTGAVACVAAVGYYRVSRSAWSQSWTETESVPGDPSDDPLDRLAFRAPESLVATGTGAPLAVGVVVALLTGEWRWAETGFAVGAVLPAFGVIVSMLVVEAGSGHLRSGHLLFGCLLVVGGLPAVLLGWLWTADIRVLLIGGAIAVVGALASALLASTAALRGD